MAGEHPFFVIDDRTDVDPKGRVDRLPEGVLSFQRIAVIQVWDVGKRWELFLMTGEV